MDDENPLESKETLDELQHHRQGWTRYLAMSTALIAVFAAVASLVSGDLVNSALLAKNEAVLEQSKSSDQYNFYQAKGIKKSLADYSYQQSHNAQAQAESERYAGEQVAIKKAADDLALQVEGSNVKAEKYLHSHHRAAIAVTLSQIAIALAAMSALLGRRSFWVLSLSFAVVGAGFFMESLL